MLSPGGFQFAWCIWFTIHSLCYVMSIYYDYCIYIYTYRYLYTYISLYPISFTWSHFWHHLMKKRPCVSCGIAAIRHRVELRRCRPDVSRWKVGRFTSDLPHLSNATHGRLMELTVFLGSKWTSWKLNLHFPGEKGKGPQVPTVSFFSEMVDVFLLRLLEGIMLWIFVGVSEHQQLRRPAKITQFLSHNDAKVREAAAIPASVWSFGPFFWYFLNRCNVIHVLN